MDKLVEYVASMLTDDPSIMKESHLAQPGEVSRQHPQFNEPEDPEVMQVSMGMEQDGPGGECPMPEREMGEMGDIADDCHLHSCREELMNMLEAGEYSDEQLEAAMMALLAGKQIGNPDAFH